LYPLQMLAPRGDKAEILDRPFFVAWGESGISFAR
jgi:hypothetical protein